MGLLSILITIGSKLKDFEIMIRMWCVKNSKLSLEGDGT
jgi:hypothetical protein